MVESENISSNRSQGQENSLESERCKDFYRAVDTLYISGNMSGRHHFTKEWPEAAMYIFGEELIRFDTEGTSDYERRALLENEAEDRRMHLLDILDSFAENSVSKGALQMDYVEKVIKDLGREVSLLVYHSRIVDKVLGFASTVPAAEAVPERGINSAGGDYTQPPGGTNAAKSAPQLAHPEIRPIDVDDVEPSVESESPAGATQVADNSENPV